MKRKRGYSVKPGRANAAMGVMGGIFGIIFAIIWTCVAIGVGAPWFFALFGIFFIVMTSVSTYMNYKNATGENRYSEYDVVDINDEPDPWDKNFEQKIDNYRMQDCGHVHNVDETRFCPYCGAQAQPDYQFCKSCGKRLPE